MPEIDCFYADNNFCVSFWQNVAMIDICHDMDIARMKKVGKAYEALLARYPDVQQMVWDTAVFKLKERGRVVGRVLVRVDFSVPEDLVGHELEQAFVGQGFAALIAGFGSHRPYNDGRCRVESTGW